jgi:hypothetical protein
MDLSKVNPAHLFLQLLRGSSGQQQHQIQADFDAVAGQWILDTVYRRTRL